MDSNYIFIGLIMIIFGTFCLLSNFEGNGHIFGVFGVIFGYVIGILSIVKGVM